MEFGEIMQNNGHYAVKVIQGYNFLCVNNSNLHPILHCVQDMADYWSSFHCQQGTSL